MSDSSRPHGLQCTWLACPSPSPVVCPSSSSLTWWCHPISSSSKTVNIYSWRRYQWWVPQSSKVTEKSGLTGLVNRLWKVWVLISSLALYGDNPAQGAAQLPSLSVRLEVALTFSLPRVAATAACALPRLLCSCLPITPLLLSSYWLRFYPRWFRSLLHAPCFSDPTGHCLT